MSKILKRKNDPSKRLNEETEIEGRGRDAGEEIEGKDI